MGLVDCSMALENRLTIAILSSTLQKNFYFIKTIALLLGNR
jgi:hypothetical protein